jgi:hypothetical protein
MFSPRCRTSATLFFLLFCFVSASLLFLLVVELLSIVAQGVSRGSDEKGKR